MPVGVALGQQAARAILSLREGDGWDVPGTYTFQAGPGAYQNTPPWNGFVAQPGFRFAKPFGFETPEQFRPPPPPALHSTAYAAAYNEVKDFGRKDSSVRTPDQTGYAWWMEFAEGSVNRLARRLVADRHLHLWRAARLFALLNMCRLTPRRAPAPSRSSPAPLATTWLFAWRRRPRRRTCRRDPSAASPPPRRSAPTHGYGSASISATRPTAAWRSAGPSPAASPGIT